MFRKMKRKNTIAILLVLVATAFLVVSCRRDREPLCEEEPMAGCEKSNGTCVIGDVGGVDGKVAMCVCQAPLFTYGLACATRKETCQEQGKCAEDADCRVNNVDINYVCEKASEDAEFGVCAPDEDFEDKCQSDFLCVVELASDDSSIDWTTDCSQDGRLCDATETCVKIGTEEVGEGDDKETVIVGRCVPSDCPDEVVEEGKSPKNYMMLVEVCPDPADTDNVKYYGNAAECKTSVSEIECTEGWTFFSDQCGCGCIKGKGTAKACAYKYTDAVCNKLVGCHNPCNEDADCGGGLSKCDSGACVCASNAECVANVPGTSTCNEGSCECASDQDCLSDKLGDECVGGVCRCSSASVCTADTVFDGDSWKCAL